MVGNTEYLQKRNLKESESGNVPALFYAYIAATCHIIYYKRNNCTRESSRINYMRNKCCGGNSLGNLILGIDAGNHTAKVAGDYGIDSYRTAICDWFERNK